MNLPSLNLPLIALNPKNNYLIKASWIFDGLKLTNSKSLFISHNLIQEKIKLPLTQVFDFEQCTILPGLVDAHVHLALHGENFKETVCLWEKNNFDFSKEKSHLAQSLKNGIMALRDGGDLKEIGLKLAKENLPLPLIRSGGQAFRKKELYGSFLGEGYKAQDYPNLISAYSQKKADYLKVLVSGIASFKEYGKVGHLQYTQEELTYLVQLAQKYNLGVMAHTSSDLAVKIAVKAGVKSIEHGYFVKEDTLKEMAEKNITWIPTLTPVANQLKEPFCQNYTKEQLEIISKMVYEQQKSLNKAYQLGVPIAVGTDAGANGVFHGKDYHNELKLYQKANLPLNKILSYATNGGAKLISQYPLKLSPLKKPYFIVVKGNPLENLSCLKKIKAVFYPQNEKSLDYL